ncbi:MAG TPA: hypothetical protein VG187_19160 [Mycobacterium sp.]|jgi:hypothetical protein|nr:hypothetical protein [Mycobacterium sp.]
MYRRINLTLGAAAAGLLGAAFLPVAVAVADTDPFTLFGADVMTTVSPTELTSLDASLLTGDPTLAATLSTDVTTGQVPFGLGEAPFNDDAFANLLPADATAAQINEAANFDAILYNGDPTLAATLAATDSTGLFPDAPGTDAFTIGSLTFDPYTGGTDTTPGTEGFDPLTQGTGTSPFFDTGSVDGQNFEVFGTASGSTAPAELGTITTTENVTSLFGITNTGFDITGESPLAGVTDLPAIGTTVDVTNFGSGFENIFTDVPGAAADGTTAAGTVADTFVTPFGDYDLSSLVSAFDLTALDPGAAFGLGADAGTAAVDAAGSIDPLAFLGL